MKYYITQEGRSLLENAKGRRRSDIEVGERKDKPGEDEALEGKFDQERLRFLKRKEVPKAAPVGEKGT